MKSVEPSVHLISKPAIDWESLGDYLSEVGASEWWQERYPEGLSDEAGGNTAGAGSTLIEVMGRNCYRSWEPGLNPNVTRVRKDQDEYLGNIVNVGHGSVLEHSNYSFIFNNVSRVFCYAPGTEVWTSEGWKLVESLTTNDLLLTMDPATQQARWSFPKSVHEFDYDGRLHWWEHSQIVSPAVTDDHFMWAAPYDLRRARGLSNEENVARHATKIPMSELAGKRFSVRHDVAFQDLDASAVTTIKPGGSEYRTADLLAWLGWMATDGHFPKDRPNQGQIMQSKTENLPLIRELMEVLFPGRWREHGPYGDSGLMQFVISDGDLIAWAKRMIGPSKEERRFHRDLYAFHPDLLRSMYDAAVLGDGNRHPSNGHEVIYCPSHEAAGFWQVLVAALGMCANVRVDDRTGEFHESGGVTYRHTQPGYVVSVSRKAASLVKVEHQRSEHFQGKVYCPKTSDGLILVRREGLPVWSGNTHELVRHRHEAISQESLRFVRLNDLSMWIPAWAAEDEELMVRALSLLGAMEDFQKWMADHFGLDDPGVPFSEKKHKTSFMRRFAPIGVATKIGWTANVRALRHVIEMRTSLGAEEEIRLVFDQVAQIMLIEMPALFEDAERSDEGEWIFGRKKV